MSQLVFVLAESGQGKSTSIGEIPQLGIKGLNPKSSYVINIEGKPLPFKGSMLKYNKDNKNYFETRSVDSIIKGLHKLKEREDVKDIVIDDAQYLWADMYINDLDNPDGYNKWNKVLKHVWFLLHECKNMRDDQIVYVLSHLETYNENGTLRQRMKALGQATHKYVTPEGLSTVVLYCEGEIEGETVKKYFRTQGTKNDTCKSPVGMFDDLKVKNDLGLVSDSIREYYGI